MFNPFKKTNSDARLDKANQTIKDLNLMIHTIRQEMWLQATKIGNLENSRNKARQRHGLAKKRLREARKLFQTNLNHAHEQLHSVIADRDNASQVARERWQRIKELETMVQVQQQLNKDGVTVVEVRG